MAKHRKRSSGGGFVYRLVIVILLCVIAFSLFKVLTLLNKYNEGTKAYKEIAEDVQDKKNALDIDWDKLLKKNEDIKAWIYAKDTVINYPVVRGEDNDYYLHRLLNGEYNFKGTIFIDANCERPFEDFLTIIYGHSMRDGSMFKPLFKWRDQDFYDKHKKMMILTPDQDYNLEIFACCYTTGDSDRYVYGITEKEEKTEYIDWAFANSLIQCDVTVEPDDTIVMLSTCAEATGTKRVIVYGKLVERE